MMRKGLILLSLFILTTLGIAPPNAWELAAAQTQCSPAEQIDFPVDTSLFTLGQAFGVPSPRHQGRYHTGEDWFAGRGKTEGLPVRAIAAGRVTYSSPQGWGRDGGVVIIEHTFADGSVVYSQYGHIIESDSVKFPARLSCVDLGQVIGVIANVRPAPHFHWEIKLDGGDTPGPGYSWLNPYEQDWRQPSKFVLNRQAWLLPFHRWHLQLNTLEGLYTPPLELSDHSLMYLDGSTLRLATYDGRVLWRVLLDTPALAVTGFQQQPLVIYANGQMQTVDYANGQPLETWYLPLPDDVALDSASFSFGDELLFHTSDNMLIAISANRREIRWQLEAIPAFVRLHSTSQLIALLTQDHTLYLISPDGELIDTVQLRADASFATAPDDTLVVYGIGGLWRIDAQGGWTLMMGDIQAQTGVNAVYVATDTQVYAFDGAALRAYTSEDNTERWSVPLVVSGRLILSQFDGIFVLTSQHGQIMAINDQGVLCAAAQIYGDDRALVWQALGDDGILRVAVGDQVIGLDWAGWTQPCQSG